MKVAIMMQITFEGKNITSQIEEIRGFDCSKMYKKSVVNFDLVNLGQNFAVNVICLQGVR